MNLVAIINRTALVIERTASLFLAVITVLIFVSALARYLFAWPIPDAHDLSSLFLGIAILWGLACVSWRNDHIAVDIVWLVCPRWLQRAMDILGQLLVALFIGLFAWKLLERIDSVMAAGEYTMDLRLAIWPFYALAWLGVLAALLLTLARLWQLLLPPEILASPSRAATNLDGEAY